MTQDQEPDFTELALKFVGTASLHDPLNVRIESAIEALTKAHDLGVERSENAVNQRCGSIHINIIAFESIRAEIRKLKLGKGE